MSSTDSEPKLTPEIEVEDTMAVKTDISTDTKIDTEPETKPEDRAEKKPEFLGIGKRSGIRSLQERYKNGTVETVIQEEYKPADFDPHSEYALVSQQKFKENGRLESAKIKINSPTLLRVFREVIGSHPNAPTGFDEPFDIEGPFIVLFHHWEDLEARHETTDDELEKKDLGLLLEFMKAELGKLRSEVSKMVGNNSISFDLLWTIYKPGKLVHMGEGSYSSLLKLEKTVYEHCEKAGRWFEVHCTQTFNDGTGVFRRSRMISLHERQKFGGGTPAKITSLPVYPLSSYKAKPESDLLKELEERGLRTKTLAGIKTMRYDGPAMYQQLPPRSFYDPDPQNYETLWLPCAETGRVVVDCETYLEDYQYEGESISRNWPEEHDRWAVSTFGSTDRANAILCAPLVFGYSLQRKDWCKFYVDQLEDVEWKRDSIESLILPQKQKVLLNALVKSHRYSANPREQSEQKGKGLVVLLHGTPGSGKTLTAEVAAEVAETALLPVSLGELYEYQYFDEWKLKILLRYATIWKAVVLIDEADVFLEARSSGGDSASSSERNALVAVFLRYLEYFSGIAFLTSNRVEDFDSAMKSRIHLALQYAPPASELRRRIWASRLAAIPADELGFDVAAALDGLVESEMNGREIYNSINTARTLARDSKDKLRLEHLQTVMDIWKDFNISLETMKQTRPAKQRRDSFAGLTKKYIDD